MAMIRNKKPATRRGRRRPARLRNRKGSLGRAVSFKVK